MIHYALNTKFNLGNALVNYFNELIRQYLIIRKSGVLFATCKREYGSKAFVSPCSIFMYITPVWVNKQKCVPSSQSHVKCMTS